MVKDPKIVVIGGGTGSFVVLSGLKQYFKNLTALVSMADDGGSTGQLRDELGVLPPGDIRQCLVALSNSPKLRDLFNYRFTDGHLDGHSFGNLFLAAMEKMAGSLTDGIELASEILNLTGKVEPITLDHVTLSLKDSQHTLTGEDLIDHSDFNGKKSTPILTPIPHLNPAAAKAIKQADFIIIAPGSLYTSLAPALIIPSLKRAFKASKAAKVYICNLVNKPGQTDGYTAEDYAAEVERFVGFPFLDYVLFNNNQPAHYLLKHYAAEGELPVLLSGAKTHYRIIKTNLLAKEIWQNPSKSDRLALKRTLIRHNPDALARAILRLVK